MTKHITIKEGTLDEILETSHDIVFQRNQTPDVQAAICKQEIIKASIDVDAEIKAQAQEIIKRKEIEFKETFERQIQDAVAKEKAVLTNTFEAKLKAARQQGHQQGCKDAVSLQQQLADAHKAKARAQSALEEKEDEWKGNVPAVFLVKELREAFPDDKIQRHNDGVYHETNGGAIFFQAYKTTFQTAWLKKIKGEMQQPYANYAVIVSSGLPGPRQMKEEKEAVNAGIWVAQPKNFLVIAKMLREWIARTKKQALVQSAKQDVKEELYDFVAGDEFALMRQVFLDNQKAEDKHIRQMEISLEKLKENKQKKIEQFNKMMGSIINKTKQIQTHSPAPGVN